MPILFLDSSNKYNGEVVDGKMKCSATERCWGVFGMDLNDGLGKNYEAHCLEYCVDAKLHDLYKDGKLVGKWPSEIYNDHNLEKDVSGEAEVPSED